MLQENPLSADQMTAVLEDVPVAILVSSVDDWAPLYANRQARELGLHQTGLKGAVCFGTGMEPHPFCAGQQMNRPELTNCGLRLPDSGSAFELRGKLTDWNGRSAYISYLMSRFERNAKEECSTNSEKGLETTFQSIPCGLCVYQIMGGKILSRFFNAAFFTVLGYSQDHISRIQQELPFTGVHPDDISLLRKKLDVVIQNNSVVRHTFRVLSDVRQEYRWIRLEGSIKQQKDGIQYLYAVFSDISEQVRLEKELAEANSKMMDIINAIPGGVAIYKVTDQFETVYFSEGVPGLTGYTVEQYHDLIQKDAAEMIYWEDADRVISRAMEVIRTHQVADFEFRKQHRDGSIVWVRVQINWLGEEGGSPLLHCVFHNISDLKDAQLEMDHLVNSIPGGIATYCVEGERLRANFLSDGVIDLSGYTRAEYELKIQNNATDIIYDSDRKRVEAAIRTTLDSGAALDVFYRIRHKDGQLIWIHMNGRRMESQAKTRKLYAVFTGMSAEARLFQNISNEMADGIYVIDKESYDLLYVNESTNLFTGNIDCVGCKCYKALHGKNAPCSFCTLKTHPPDGKEHPLKIDGTDHFYTTRFRESDWNGIPAYIKFVRDITQEVNTRREKERLEEYFQTVVKYLPGGVAVVCCEQDGNMTPEFLSDGFCEMTGMTLQQAWQLYEHDATAGVHPDDLPHLLQQMRAYIKSAERSCEIVYRLRKGNTGYIWVKNTLSLIQNEGEESRVYAVYHDITREKEEQEWLQQQYKDLLVQHYRTPGPNALVVGHCNITQNKILEIIDYTGSDLLNTFGTVREEFFTGISTLILDEQERKTFCGIYLNAPALAAFERNDTEQILECFIKLPQEPHGRYVQFKMNLVDTPDSGGVTGILTVTDITEQTITDRILHQLSVTSYDFVIDLNLREDSYTLLNCNQNADCLPLKQGCHSERTAYLLNTAVVPKDRKQYAQGLDPKTMRRRLEQEGCYTFSFSIQDENGDIRTKNMTVSAVDLRLDRVCLVRTDITDSLREQQGLLNMMAYTFELMCFIDVHSNVMTMYTRQTVLKNLSPFFVERYDKSLRVITDYYETEGGEEEVEQLFRLETLLTRLAEKPAGYDFVLSFRTEDGLCYKQINVLWGDQNHRTVCLVRADVTDMLAAERKTKAALEKALALAEEANRAKSDFLSAMSHDIRTPLNAVMGMTALAVAHLDDRDRVADCLQKISISSKHLLSLINDILDMSKIEQSKVSLNRMAISLPELLEQLAAIVTPQAKAAGLRFETRIKGIRHEQFYGDLLRINQILLNLLSNAVKFTPEGGRVEFVAEELEPIRPLFVRYRFTVSDSGIGMPPEFLAHLFEPFTRSRKTEQVEGTGLGLSITKKLVDLMEGRISVESESGKGSVFQIELECEIAEPVLGSLQQMAQAEASGTGKESLFAGRRFLVAEDNAINAEILNELLTMFGAETVVKSDGAQAVRAFRDVPHGTYDAVLMDIQMPVMNGYEATRAIRELNRLDAATIPIVAMTANAFAEDVQASLDAGMNAHVAKPIDIEMLRTTLNAVLSAQTENEHKQCLGQERSIEQR